MENICVVDASLIGYGVTKNSTAKVTYLQENIYSKILYNNRKFLELPIIFFITLILKKSGLCKFNPACSFYIIIIHSIIMDK